MKTWLRLMWVASFVAIAPTKLFAHYVPRVFLVGNNLFANPLLADDNTLNSLFIHAPEGAIVSLWNPESLSFDTSSTNISGAWLPNLELLPGTGARLHTAFAFTNTFIGSVLDHDGSVLTGDAPPQPPPVYSGPVGVYLLGDRCPVGATGTDIFQNVIGRLPIIGEQVILLNATNQTYTTNTYVGLGNWDTVPAWKVSDAAFFRILLTRIPLNHTWDGTNLILSWVGPGFSLAAGTNVNEITNIISTTSPCTNSFVGPRCYFQLIYQ